MDVSRSIAEVTRAAMLTLDLSTQVRTHSQNMAGDVSGLLHHTRDQLSLLNR
jgi:hypothetical protein